MQVPDRAALLQQLDSLSYGARLARLATIVRGGRGSAALIRLMDELLSGETSEANLALELARAARDEAPLLRALTHPSTFIRSRAAQLAGRCIRDDAALERALPDLSPDGRRRVLKSVVRARRGALAARLLPQVLARHGAQEAALLLSVLDDAALRRLLPELGHLVKSWRSLVRHNPDAVLGYLQARLSAAPERERAHLFERFRGPLTVLTLQRGEAVLGLVRELAPQDALPSALLASLRRLTRRHPEAVFALLTRPAMRDFLQRGGLPRGVLQEADVFSPEQRRTLARLLADSPEHLAGFLDALAPSLRAELFTHAWPDQPPRDLPEALLTVLPHALRDAEAARRLTFREVREDRDLLLRTHALRTIEHAREPLQQAAFAAKAEDRAQALALLVRSTGLSRRGLTETLGHLARLRNEQDPVRLAALEALAQVPPSLFTADHVPALTQLVTFVVEARDTSYGTRGAVQTLAFRLMRTHAADPDGPLFQLALQTLRRLAGQAGSLALPPLERDLPRGAEVRIVAALMPMIRAASERDSHGLVLALANALGRRGWSVDLLQGLLKPATQAAANVARGAIDLWLAPPRTRDGRVRELLDQDLSVVTIPWVLDHLHRRRQEWLDPFLEGRPLPGRFSPGKAGWVPPVHDGFHRWLPRQQQRFADLLLRIANDSQRSNWERAGVLHRLARLPVVTVDTLRPFLASQDVPTLEAALGALAWLDRLEPALPLLLEQLDGDRARVAMYAVPRVARLVSGETLSAALASLLGREKLKVTVHKEVLRLLGAFRSARSLPLLREQWDKPLHRDVRIAVGHAARQLLDVDETWALLDAMAQSPDAAVAASLLDQRPADLPPEARPRYAALVLRVAQHPELPVRRQAFTALPAWSPGAEDAVARAAAGRLLDLAGGAEWREATQALVETVRDGVAVEHLVASAAALLSAPVPEAQNAAQERDLPARQRLHGLWGTLLALPRPVRLRLRPRLHEVARLLAGDASLWPESAALRLAALEWKDAGAVAEALRGLAEETREEPLHAQALAGAVYSAVESPGAEWEPEVLLEASDRVKEEAPLVAVVLVGTAGRRLHWRADAASRLRALREHPRPAVRAAARALLTASE
jgi:hypothetical protein